MKFDEIEFSRGNLKFVRGKLDFHVKTWILYVGNVMFTKKTIVVAPDLASEACEARDC
jgi:hypothetical protein